MRLRTVVAARLARLGRDIRANITLRRREKRVATYALRLLVLALLVALPVKKLVQLGPLDGALALIKTALVVAFVTATLAVGFAYAELARRRGARRRREVVA